MARGRDDAATRHRAAGATSRGVGVSSGAVDEVACALLDRIAAASPEGGEDDRLVLADHLMQSGHASWGELIALSCAAAGGALTRAQGQRLRVLREDPGAWLGPVKPVTFERQVDRGLLVAAGLDGRTRGAIDAAAGHLAWRTVREIVLHQRARWTGPFQANDESVALLRRLPALRALRGVTTDVMRELAHTEGARLAIRELELYFYGRSIDPMFRELHESLGGPVFETVRELALGSGLFRGDRVDPAELDWWLEGAPITSHVEALRLGYLPRLAPWWQALTRAARPVLRACHAHDLVTDFKLERDAAGRWSRLTVRCRERPHLTASLRLERLERELALLPRGALAEIELQVPAAMRPAFERRGGQIAARQPDAAIAVTGATAGASP